eukprot:1297871-Heterocapsa_arctica.AAC.1
MAQKGQMGGMDPQMMIDDKVAILKKEQIDDENKKEYCSMQLDLADDKKKDLDKSVAEQTEQRKEENV